MFSLKTCRGVLRVGQPLPTHPEGAQARGQGLVGCFSFSEALAHGQVDGAWGGGPLRHPSCPPELPHGRSSHIKLEMERR